MFVSLLKIYHCLYHYIIIFHYYIIISLLDHYYFIITIILNFHNSWYIMIIPVSRWFRSQEEAADLRSVATSALRSEGYSEAVGRWFS